MKNYMLMGVSTLALVAVAQASHAQANTEVVAAGERLAADHAPLGVRAGSFLVIPKVELQETYNDNIYATEANEESDFITTAKAEIAARSNWSRHALNAVVKGDARRYADNNDENQENYTLATDGRVDVMRDTSIGGGISYAEDHEERGDPNTIGSPSEPVKYNTTLARIGAYRGLGKANARFDSEVKMLEFSNGTSTTGAAINNSVRDRNEYSQSLRLGYRLTDTFEGFVRGVVDNRVYDNKTNNRTNRGQAVVAGTSFDVTGKTKGEAFVGTAKRKYSNAARPEISEPVWGGKVTWNATDLTSVIASVDRGIEETTLNGSSGFVSTDYRVVVEHALTRDILLKGNAGYTNNEYQGAAAFQREDDIMSAGVGVDYWMNRCLKAGLGYSYSDRDSNVTGGDYGRNAVMLKLTATY